MLEILTMVALAACRLLAGACALATLLPLTRSKLWWVRAGDFPRQQIAVLGGLAAAGLLALWSWLQGWDMVLLAALAAALAWQLAMILPYTRLWPRQGVAGRGQDARSVRLVVVNVLMTNRKVDGLARSLAATGPDIVLALETDRWWTERLGELLPEHRHRLLHPLDNTYGMALLSRLELTRAELRFLLDPEIPSIRARVRLRSGDEIGLIGVHPKPPSPSEADTSLPRDAELVMLGREVAGENEPVIVAGDLNDVAWSRTSRLFRRLSGLIDPRVGRGFYNSYHADHRWLRWPLDHVFYSQDFLLRRLARLPAFGSDHFPILIELEYRPRAAAAQPLTEPDREDRRHARATVAEAEATDRE